MLAHEGVAGNGVVRGHGADDDGVAVLTDATQGVDPAQVHHDLRRGEAQPQDRQQALAAAEDLDVLSHVPSSSSRRRASSTLVGAW